MAETQLASMRLGSVDTAAEEALKRAKSGNNIFIIDGQDDTYLDHIHRSNVMENEHEQSLENTLDLFELTALGDKRYAEHLGERNGLIVPGEDGELLEFRIFESHKYRDTTGALLVDVYSQATYTDLINARIIDPHTTGAETAQQHANLALQNTEWQVGNVDYAGIRTLTFDNYTNPYAYLKRIAREFELELRFYVTTDGQRITGRYVDLIDRVGEWRGRTVEFGRDLQGIRRIERTDEVVTALRGIGPEREDGSRLEVFVEDEEALQRWGRKGRHIVDVYEPQSERTDMTESELEQYTRTELNKRINAIVSYEADIIDLENVPGMENKKIRFGDTIRIKDTKFNPPLYLEARIYNQKRDVFTKANKRVELGDYTEFTEEEVRALFEQLREQIRTKISQAQLVDYAEKKIPEQPTAPDPAEHPKWVDTSEEIPKMKLWNGEEWTTVKGDKGDPGEDGYTPVKGVDYFDGEDGQDGESAYLWIRYSQNADGSDMTTDPTNAKYIGIATTTTPSAPTSHTEYDWSKYVGDDGIPGEDGEDGRTSYLHIKYSNDGGQTFTGNNGEDVGDWIGTYVDFTQADSDDVNDYTWNKVKGEKGDKGDPGEDGKDGIAHMGMEPPSNPAENATWFETNSEGQVIAIKKWTGSDWETAKMDGATTLAVEVLSALTANLGNVTAGHITGVTMNLANGKFVVYANGNVAFGGHLEGATGTFTGDVIREGTNYIMSLTNFYISATQKNDPETYTRIYPSSLQMQLGGPQRSFMISPNYLRMREDTTNVEKYLNVTIDSAFDKGELETRNVDYTIYDGEIKPQAHEFLSLQNGWTNTGGSYEVARYTKNPDSMVYLSGLVESGSYGTTIATLPVGCRPRRTEIFIVSTGGDWGRVYVYTDGRIVANKGSGVLSLSGIAFRGEN